MVGGNYYDTDVHAATMRHLKSTGAPVFAHTSAMRSKPAVQWDVHGDLDPKWTAGDASPLAGKRVRESRDNDANPESVALAVMFDVTGSMATIPQTLVEKLPMLESVVKRKGYIEFPQILFGAFGDANCDRVPLQIGQFEADNKRDDQLRAIFLEGGGGGHGRETSELAMYYFARHTALDCFTKRGKKGYFFLITDEKAYDPAKRDQIGSVIGDTPEANVPLAEISAQLRERYEVFVIIPQHESYGRDGLIDIENFWKLVIPGERVIRLDNPDAVCETIALAIGLTEGMIDLDAGIDHLTDAGVSDATAASASKALATYASGKGGAVAVVSGGGDLDMSGDSGVATL